MGGIGGAVVGLASLLLLLRGTAAQGGADGAERALCTPLYLQEGARRVTTDCCPSTHGLVTPTATSGHRRRLQAAGHSTTQSSCSVPATCTSELCAHTFTDFCE